MSNWISVKENLPKHFERVIVCRQDGTVEQGHRDVNGWWKVYGARTKRVTHWMPMPEPPKEDLQTVTNADRLCSLDDEALGKAILNTDGRLEVVER